MYPKEFYHTKREAEQAAVAAAGRFGFVDDQGETDTTNFDYIAPDAINDDRDGTVPAFWAHDVNGVIMGVYAYPYGE